MFKKLTNEAVITYKLRADGPLLINSGEASKIDPTLPDMRFVRLERDGKQVAYLPGSSLKGVFRTRYEQLGKALGGNIPVCNPFSDVNNKNCHRAISNRYKYDANMSKEAKADGTLRYKHSCFACRLFGSLSLAGRIRFTDAYPSGEVKFGMRNGVGIDRITGAANGGKLYNFEVIEEGTFAGKIHLANYQPYQLIMILWILKDIDDGLVTLGMGGSRGNGKMILDGACSLMVRQYDGNEPALFVDIDGESNQSIIGREWRIAAPERVLDRMNLDEMRKQAIGEGWGECYVTDVLP